MKILKKSIAGCLFVLLFVLFTYASQAQMSVGLRGGVNFSNLSMEDVSSSSFKPKTRLNFGLLFNYSLSSSTSIQIETGFSQRGAKISDDASVMTNNQNFRYVAKGESLLNYIEVPILFQYKPKLGKLEGILSLGPELRLLTSPLKVKLKSKLFINDELVEERTEETSLSGDNNFKEFDFGMVGGAGIAYPVRTLKIFAEGRYHFGLNNLRKDDDLKIHNRGASVHVGILVPVGK